MDQAGELAARLGLPVKDRALLERALIHGSFTNEHPDEPGGSNERLEFLGDSVVSLVISEALFERHPGEDEGVLTARRASLVSTRALARVAQRLRLDGVVEPDTPAGAVAHGPPDLVHEIGARQHCAPDPVPAEQGQLVGQERDVEQRDDRLRARARQGAQARTLAPGQDDGGYVPGVQGCASLMSITGMPS
jgi:hypothetical protein